jgi:cell division transport system permease protein
MTLAGILTVTVSLALLGGILLFQRWVDHGTEQWKHGVEFEVFMKVNATKPQISAVRTDLGHDPKVKRAIFITKDEAYKEFQRIFKDKPDLVASVDPSALPASFRVVPTKVEDTKILKQKYAARSGVDEAVTPDKAIKQLLDVTRFLRVLFIGISLVLVASSVFLIVNTIRLATFARRREVEVMKLVGASNWFVRIPFMAEGLIEGLIGAALAVSGVFGLKLLFERIQEGFFQRYFVTSGEAGVIGISLIVAGALIGVIGSGIGLRRFLRV